VSSDFKLSHVLNVLCFRLGNSPASEFYMPTFRNTLFYLYRWIGAESLCLRNVRVFIGKKIWLKNGLSQYKEVWQGRGVSSSFLNFWHKNQVSACLCRIGKLLCRLSQPVLSVYVCMLHDTQIPTVYMTQCIRQSENLPKIVCQNLNV
jgi:hypothetical protein